MSAYTGLSHPVKESRDGAMLTELEYHGYSPRLQELTLSRERALGVGLQTWEGITFEDVNGSTEQTEKPKPRELFNRGLQIPLGLPSATSDPCTKSTHLDRIWSEAEGLPVHEWAPSWQS